MEKINYKIVIIGESMVGKTSLITRYTKNIFSNTSVKDRTVNAYGVEKTISVNETVIKLTIWVKYFIIKDTAGEEKYHALTPMYYRDADGVILVFDLTNADTFNTITKWIEEVKSHCKSDIKIILCGNKCDIQDQQQITYEQAKKYSFILKRLAENSNANYVVASARKDVNVADLFSSLALRIISF